MPHVVSNSEFVQLTSTRSPRLRAMAKARYDDAPQGQINQRDLGTMLAVCRASGGTTDVAWLRSLSTLASSGALQRVRQGRDSWEDHVVHVRGLQAQKQIPFGLNDLVSVIETGKSGVIADYNTQTDEYVVVLNPFQVVTLPAKDLVAGVQE